MQPGTIESFSVQRSLQKRLPFLPNSSISSIFPFTALVNFSSGGSKRGTCVTEAKAEAEARMETSTQVSRDRKEKRTSRINWKNKLVSTILVE